TGTWNLNQGGTISGGTIAAPTGGARLESTNGVLKGVILNADVDLSTGQFGNTLKIVNGMTLNSIISLGKAVDTQTRTLIFEGTQTVAGTGTIVFVGDRGSVEIRSTAFGNNATLTIGPNITIRGKTGVIQAVQF